jgi:leucyl aminopeptidase
MVPISTNVSIEIRDRLRVGVEASAVFITQGSRDGGESVKLLADDEQAAVMRMLRSGISRGKAREVHFDLIDEPSRSKPQTTDYRRVLLAGLGKPEKLTTEVVRQAAGALARSVRKLRLHDVAVAVPRIAAESGPAIGPAEMAETIVSGIMLASFYYGEYRGPATRAREDGEAVDEKRRVFTLLCAAEDLDDVRRGAERGRIIAEGQNFARTIASRPANNINPPSLAKVAQDLARDVGLEFRALDEKQMQKLGMGGILAVGSGSISTPPRMIVLEHRPRGASKGQAKSGSVRKGKRAAIQDAAPLLVVGKAITFDTGGISIKPAEKMGRMIFDKCGGMAVLGLMYAVAKLKLPVHVVGILSSAENAVSSMAYRPGDILRMYNGVTVEVTNTDAEGRLVLGDALAWGIETYKPAAVVDLATLTGGVVVALGKTMAGVMDNSEELVKELSEAAQSAGERIWRLPLGEDQRDYIKSEMADIVNSGGREGHPLQGGAFLSYFVPSDPLVPWAHLDIAGVADTEKELPYYAKGATGWGVRTLVEWVSGRVVPRTPHATPRAAGG